MTQTPEEEIILEPGDPGYVAPDDPNAPPPDNVPEGWQDPADEDQIEDPVPIPSPPGEVLEFERLPGESDADRVLRTRGMVVDSKSPTDVVPNTPQITMGPPIEEIEDEDIETVETVDGFGTPSHAEDEAEADQVRAGEPLVTEPEPEAV